MTTDDPAPPATTAAERLDRDPTTGRFGRGNPGRPKGARHVALVALEKIGEENAEALMQKAVQLGLAGDTTALRILLDRLVPAPRGRLVRFDLPQIRTAADAAEAAGAVLRAVAAGDLSPEEGGAVASLLEAHREAILLRDLDERVRQMEERRSASPA